MFEEERKEEGEGEREEDIQGHYIRKRACWEKGNGKGNGSVNK